MLKQRIAVAMIALSLSLPSLSSASPLSWVPRLDALAKVTRLWNLLPGMHSGTAAPAARDPRKNGPGMDPTGSPVNPGSGSSGSTTTADPSAVTGQ